MDLQAAGGSGGMRVRPGGREGRFVCGGGGGGGVLGGGGGGGPAKPGLLGTVVRLQTPGRVARGLGWGSWDHELSRTSVFTRARFGGKEALGGKEAPGGSTERTPRVGTEARCAQGGGGRRRSNQAPGPCWRAGLAAPRTQSRNLILISAHGRGSTVSICFLIC